ncbi:MAG: hypothetical protein KF767_05400 [Bdellovibrionaceae bacterium]|nr:hypothetical protein [Pseudobdellovibrionaceae bacterium]
MNFVVIGVLSSVVLLAGCTQNESRRTQTPAAPAAVGPDMPKPEEVVKGKALPPEVNLGAGDVQTQYGRTALPEGSLSVEPPRDETNLPVGSTNVAIPAVPAVTRVEDPATMANPPADLRLQPSRPVEIVDASPDFPEDMPRPAVTAPSGVRPATAVTGVTASTAAFRPVPPPSVEDQVEAEATPATPEQRRGQEQRFRPMPKDDVAVAPTGARTETAPTGPAQSVNRDTHTTTVVVVAATGVTGPTGRDGQVARPAVTASTSVTEAPTKFEVKDYKVIESKAYSVILKPMLQKIRVMNAATADRLEKKLKELKLRTYNAADADIWKHFQADVLVAGFRLPEQTEYRLVQLKDAVLIPAKDMATDESAARWILESVLFRMAYETAQKKDMSFMSSVTGLAHSVADSFIKSRDKLKKRQVYEYLRHAQVSVDEWTFEQLNAIEASSAILRLSLREYTVTMAQPTDAFDVRTLDASNPRDENCRVNITYHGIEKGVLVQVSEPQWREFEFTFDVQSKEMYPLRPSLAGDDFLDLEIIKKQADKTSLRLTVRFKVQAPGSETERIADHMVLEKLPEKGKAEKILMCRIVPWPDVPPRARTEEEKPVTAPTGSTTVRGQEQRFRPMPANTGAQTLTAPTGSKTLVSPTGAKNLVAPTGAQKLVAPTGAKKPVTASTAVSGKLAPSTR